MRRRFLYCFLSLFLYFVLSIDLHSQSDDTVLLNIIDKETGKPVRDAVCNSYNKDNKLTAYSFSDNDGNANIKTTDANYVVISNMGYESHRVEVSLLTKGQKNIVKLSPKTIKLKEIVVRAMPVVRQKDTIVYNVASFASKEDKYIGDVLKKLPGVTVSDNGNISYQGKSISKFYIEGQDLMDTRYGQMTNNFPAEAVSQVHLMENHQNIKALKDKVFEERAALNIKLKKEYKTRLFGYIDAGIGAKPIVWDAKFFSTLISSRLQTLSTIKTNNRGDDLSTETREQLSVDNIKTYIASSDPFIDFYSVALPPFDKKRFLQNNALSFGLNNLLPISQNSSVRLNINGYLDRIKAQHYKQYVYGGQLPLDIMQTNMADDKKQEYSAKMTYNLNGNSLYVNDEFSGKISNYKQHAAIKENATDNTQYMSVRPRHVENKLYATIGMGKRFLTFNSALRYHVANETLNNINSLYDKRLSASYYRSSIATRNAVSTSLFDYGNMSSSISLSANFARNRYKDLEKSTDTETRDLTLSLMPSVVFRDNSWGRLSLDMPFCLNSQRLLLGDVASDTYMTVMPRVAYSVDPSNNFRIGFSYNYNVENDWASPFYSPVSLLRSYRLLVDSPSDLFRKSQHTVSFSLFYQNMINMFFASLDGFYSNNKSQFYRDYDYTEDLTRIRIRKGDNYKDFFFVTVSGDKTFTDYGLSLKMSLDYNFSRVMMSQYGNIFTNGSNRISPKISAEYKKWDFIKIYYSSVCNFLWNRNGLQSGDMLKTFDNRIDVFVYPSKNVIADLSYQNVANEIRSNSFKVSHFLDFTISYVLNKTVELKGEILNLLGNDVYYVSSFDGINFQSSRMPLRGREFFVSCKFSF